MTEWAGLGEELKYLARGFIASLMPAPENRRLGVAWGVDVGQYSMAIGLVEAVAGGLGFFFGAIAFMTGAVPVFNQILLENWWPGMTSTHVRGGGLVALLIWCTHPLAWFMILEGVTGTVRIFTFVSTREAVGEPVVWMVVRVVGLIRRGLGRQREAMSFGPLRADRLTWPGEQRLEVLCCRPRPEWEEGMTFDFDGRFMRLAGGEDRVEGAYHVMAYSFEELPEHDVIRHPVKYVDTVAALATKNPRGRGRLQ